MRKLTLRTDRLAELRTDELHLVAVAAHTPLCPVTDAVTRVKEIVDTLLTGACITPPPSQPQLTCGCS